jgi:ketosteroid isomerase-like protein
MAASTKLVTDLIAAFNRRDIDGIMDFFTEDSICHNLPMKPVTGGPRNQRNCPILHRTGAGSELENP